MIERILVPLDGSDIAEQSLPHAAALAKAFDARVILARVPEPMLVPVMSAGVWITRTVESAEAHEETREYLEEVAGRPMWSGVEVETTVPTHPVVHGILEAVEETEADLLMMTTHGHTGPDRWVFGSVTEKLVQVAKVPLYIVRAQEEAPDDVSLRRLVVPLDGSKLSERALEAAQTLATGTGASVMLVRVPVVPGYLTVVPETAGWIPDQLQESAAQAEAYLAEHASTLREAGIDVDEEVRIVLAGSIADGILEEADSYDADLVVMSSHGRSGVTRWFFGSVANKVLRNAHTAVWIIRGETGRAV